jgi:hypothetical protein
MQWLCLLITDLSPSRPEFFPQPAHVTFVVDKVALEQVLLPAGYLSFPPMVHALSVKLVRWASVGKLDRKKILFRTSGQQ